MAATSRAAIAMVGIVALSVAGLAACGGNQDIAALAKGAHPSTSSSAVDPPATVTFNPANGATSVNPTAPITVTAGGGTINTVSLRSSTGAVIAGSLSADKTAWTASQPLGYNHTYTATADALNTAGRSAQSTAKFTTLAPRNLTMPYIDTTSGGALVSGSTYGVGIVPVVHFDEKITDKAAAEKALVVTTTPAVTGAWYWSDSQNAHWRPETYYAPGTQVTVAANVFGLQVGSGLYGESNVSASFTIGAKHVSIADDNTHQVSVYFGDVLQRTMPTSMGKGGYATGSQGQHISFYTPLGLVHRHREGPLGRHGLLDLRSARQGPRRLQRDHPVRHQDQYRRHLPARAGQHRRRAGSLRHVPRLPEPEQGQCHLVPAERADR